MSEKLQQAITNIKSGNKQLGQQLLAQILQTEPNNETAWFWMSAVVDEDKRKYCIERVLKINPNNQAAKEALDRLKKIESKDEQVNSSSNLHFTTNTSSRPPIHTENIVSEKIDLEDSQSNASLHNNEIAKPSISITKTVLADGLKMGLLGGLLGIPLPIIAVLLENSRLMDNSFIFQFAILLSIGLSTGILFFRRKIGANIAVSLGGGLSGFVAGEIHGITMGYLTNNQLWMVETNKDMLIVILVCGALSGTLAGGFNAITVWLPRIFIKRDKKVLSNLEKANLQIEAEAINIKKYGDLKKPLPPFQTPINESQNPQTTSQIETKLPAPPLTIQHKAMTSPSMDSSKNINNQEPLSLETKQQNPIASSLPQFWVNPTRKGSYIFVLFNEKMFTAKCEQRHNLEVAAKLSLGEVPTDLLTEKVNIPYSKLIKVEEVSNSLKIEFNDQGNHTETIRVQCKDQETATDIVSAIQQKLGSEFERTVAPMTISSILLGNGILITIILALSALFFYGAMDIQNNGIPEGGSARARGIVALLELLGPGGVACIGGGLLLLILFSMISTLIKPPLVTTFSRRNIYSIKKAESIQKSELPIETQTTPKEADSKETSSPFAAALSDGLLVGLIGGLIGLPMPILYLLTKNNSFNNIGMAVDFLMFLFTGVAIGILFYSRKLQRGTAAIGVGGGCGGAIAGGIFGLVFGLSVASSSIAKNLDGMSGNEFQVAVGFSIFASISTAFISASTAWIPGLFIKPDPNIKPYDWRDNKTEVQVARIENAQKNYMRKLKTRFIFGGIAIAIIFFISLCQSLLNN